MPQRQITARQFMQLVESSDGRSLYDGAWTGACVTTHIYCRTLCPTVAHASLKNVAAFPSPAAAEEAGYRPCLICCPDDYEVPTREQGFSEEACVWAAFVREHIAEDNIKTLIAQKYSMDEESFERMCMDEYGVDCEHYIATARRLAAKKMLREGNPTLEQAAQACGFVSASSLSDEFDRIYGLDAQALANKKPHAPRLARR